MAAVPQCVQQPVDTKHVIAHTATRLFARHGYDGTTIRDIAEEAMVTKPTLYYYFKNKEDLYIWLIQEAYDFFLKELREIIHAEGGFHERLKRLVHLYLDCVDEYEDTIRLIYNAAFGTSRNHPKVDILKLEQQHLDLLSEFFSEGINGGMIRNVPMDVLLLQFTGSVSSFISFKLVFGEPLPDGAGESLLDLLINGIGVRS